MGEAAIASEWGDGGTGLGGRGSWGKARGSMGGGVDHEEMNRSLSTCVACCQGLCDVVSRDLVGGGGRSSAVHNAMFASRSTVGITLFACRVLHVCVCVCLCVCVCVCVCVHMHTHI
jgi:hypothetical protein